MTSGFKTSEFWITLLIILLGGGTAFIVFSQPGSSILSKSGAIIGIIVAFVKAHLYSLQRVELKIQELYKMFNPGVNTPPKPTPTPTPAPSPSPVAQPTPEPAKETFANVVLPLPQGDDGAVLDIKYKFSKKK